MRVFIDTWGWITLGNSRENLHGIVKKWYPDFRKRGGSVYTSDYVLDETNTLLFRKLPFSKAKESFGNIEKAIDENYLNLEFVSPDRFEMAKLLRLKYDDKPLISFTDLTSFVIISELNIEYVLTEDRHFFSSGLKIANPISDYINL
jgi:uncharacterized protein